MRSVWSARLLRVAGRQFQQARRIPGVDSMADGTRNGDSGNGSRDKSPDEAALSARLGSLDDRLSEIRDNRKIRTGQTGSEQDGAQAKASAMAIGLRLSSELVAGVLVGAALGWGFALFLVIDAL